MVARFARYQKYCDLKLARRSWDPTRKLRAKHEKCPIRAVHLKSWARFELFPTSHVFKIFITPNLFPDNRVPIIILICWTATNYGRRESEVPAKGRARPATEQEEL